MKVAQNEEQEAHVGRYAPLGEPRATASAVLPDATSRSEQVMPIVTPLGERITTNRTIAADLDRSLLARRGIDRGETFADFIEACRLLGITDNTRLASIEVGVAATGSGCMTATFDADGVDIREGR